VAEPRRRSPAHSGDIQREAALSPPETKDAERARNRFR